MDLSAEGLQVKYWTSGKIFVCGFVGGGTSGKIFVCGFVGGGTSGKILDHR